MTSRLAGSEVRSPEKMQALNGACIFRCVSTELRLMDIYNSCSTCSRRDNSFLSFFL